MMDMSGAALLLARRASAAQFDPPEPPRRPDPRAEEPPTVRRARRAVRVQFAVAGALLGTFAVRLPDIAARADLAPDGVGVALGAAGTAALVALPLAGAVASRWGTRLLAVGALALYAAALPALALVDGLPGLLLALVALGAGDRGLHIATNAQATYVERHAGRPLLSGLHAWSSIGGVAAAGLAVLLVPTTTPLAVHLGGVALVLGGLALAAVPRMLPEPPRLPLRPRLVRPPAHLAGLAGLAGLGVLVEDVTGAFGPVFASVVAGGGAASAAAAYGAFAAAIVVVRLAGDWAVRHLGSDGFLRASGGLVAGGAALAVARPSPGATVVAVALVGVGVAGVGPLVLRRAAGRTPHDPGLALAAVSSAGYLGGMIGPLVIGGLAALAGLRMAFLAVVAVGVAVALTAGHARTPTSQPGDVDTIPW